MKDEVCIVDQQYDIKFANSSLKKEFGECEGKKCYAYFHDRTKICPWCKNKEVWKGKTVRWEWTFPKNNKTYDLIDTPLIDSEGKISKLEIFRDITEKQKIEETLKESEEKYRTLYNSSKDAIMTLAPPEWKFTAGNLATIKMFRCKDEKDFTSRAPYELSPKLQPDKIPSSEKALMMINKAMKEGSNFFEWTHKRVNGEEFHATVLLTKVELGDRMFLQATVRDITDQKKAEKKLKESEEKYKNLVENANDAIIIADVETGLILDANKKAELLLGRTINEIIGMNRSEIHPKDKIEYYKKQFQSHIKGKNVTDSEAEIIKKDGTLIPVSISASIIELKGKKVIQGIFRDITERKKAELEKQKMQEKLKEYAKRLEIKIKELEKDNVRLTDKEKLVLWGMTKYPTLNDGELAHILKIKRSTITSIRNRLKKEKMYATLNIPNFKKLGAKLMTLTYGRFNIPIEKRKEIIKKENIEIKEPNLMIHSDNEFVDLIVSEDMTEFERNNASTYHALNKHGMVKKSQTTHFFLDLNKIRRFLDYSHLLKHLFDIKIKEKAEEEEEEEEEEEIKLNKNEKIVLLKMIEHPEASAYDLSFKTNLTRITCAKIKKRFLDEKIIKTTIIPNIEKLGIELITLSHLNQDYGMTKETIGEILEKNPNIIFMIESGREAMWVSIFKNYKEHAENLNKTLNAQQELNERLITLKILTRDIKIKKYDFLNITKKLLKEPVQ